MSNGWGANPNPILKKIELKDNIGNVLKVEVHKEDVYITLLPSSIRLTKEQYEELRFFMVMG